ncbi:lysozyme, putative [Entamoeba invadens IP1]|uniref:Lysozyme, putative n=1 Tax=Entamoeba invadens IP1 TaxID=370355 RepID=A0A0A1UGK1_ENTIV|nr:lysozyme, putative [Entamoeba invadens IP1]ELP92737.1 lysozyme, putative [Entamoeba invadens IP1]|eukprot:XP_004259508.1 lysozyme, putative [Entamoeba invadens IP1]
MLLLFALVLSIHAWCDHRDVIGKDLIDGTLAGCLAGKHTYAAAVAFTDDGKFNLNVMKNSAYLRGAGFREKGIDFIFRPCVSCGDTAGQLSGYHVNSVQFSHNGVIVEIRVGQWSSNKQTNIAEMESLMKAALKVNNDKEPVMILTSKEDWEAIFGADYVSDIARAFPLIYVGDTNDNMDDFVAFGSWTKATEKMKGGKVLLCNTSLLQTVRC